VEPIPPIDENNSRTELLPLFPLGTVLLPEMPLSLHVFEPRYRQLVADLLSDTDPAAPVFGVVALRQGWEVGELSDVHDVGTTARVTDLVPHPDGRCDLTAVGERRFTIQSIDTASQPYLMASVRYLGEPAGDIEPGDSEKVRQALLGHLNVLAALTETEVDLSTPPVTDLSLSYAVARLPTLPLEDRQLLLSCGDTAGRLAAARRILRRETILMRQLHSVPAGASAFRTNQPPS
jgi:Lon protease-like protein